MELSRRTECGRLRERVVGEISTATVSDKSPRQIIGSSCVRTAGVRSTGENAALFLARVSGSRGGTPVASVASASVASASVVSAPVVSVASVASGALRSARPVPCGMYSGVVASLRTRDAGCASPVSGHPASSPVALLGRLLRPIASVVASRSVSLPGVAYGRVASRPPVVASGRVGGVGGVAGSVGVGVSVRSVGGVKSSPRQVLRRVFERLAETARDGVSRRLSRRFGIRSEQLPHISVARIGISHQSRQLRQLCAGGMPQAVPVASQAVAFAPIVSRPASPARASRLH